MPSSMNERLIRWRHRNPTWKLKQWSSADCELNKCLYTASARRKQLWAYCSDYVRLYALYEQGGVYLDTDVELLNSLDPLADGALHVGYMHNCALGTAVIVSPPGHAVIGELLAFYEQLDGEQMINNNAVFTEYFLQEVPAFKLDGRLWKCPGICVHPKTAFEQPNLLNRGYAVHLFNQSWSSAGTRNGTLHHTEPGTIFALKRKARALLEESRCFYLRYHLRDRYRLPVQVPKLKLSFDASCKSAD